MTTTPRKSSWVTVDDYYHDKLILDSCPFELVLREDGSWAGELAEALDWALRKGGLSWPRRLTGLKLSEGSYSLGAVLRVTGGPKKDALYLADAKKRLESGDLQPLCALVVEGAKPGAKLTGMFLFEIQ